VSYARNKGLAPMWWVATLAVVTACLAAGRAGAALPPVGRPGPGAAVAPDTALVEFLPSGAGPAPTALHVLADTVSFGGTIDVAWDLPAGADAGAFRAPVSKGEQLVFVPATGRPAGQAGEAAGLPAATGPRVMTRYRVYATDGIRLQWKGQVSPVVSVLGRVTDPAKTAAIRDPRAWPWFTWTLGLLLLLAAALAGAGWWLWRRLRRGAGPVDWALPEPAWIAVAPALRDLLARRLVERGEERDFLDGLAGLARRFAAAHYGIAAGEMTGPELVAACAGLGHESALPGALARLIEGADLRRYDPQSPSPAWCRDQAAELVVRMGEVRVLPRLTPVATERLLGAQQAWSELTAGLAGATGGAGRAAGGGD
jgi:hypothetical protein